MMNDRGKKDCIWYISKYVLPPDGASSGGRSYSLMRELAYLGARVVVITSDSNSLGKVPVLTQQYMQESIDGVDFWWIRTLKYQVAKSTRRMLSWLDFEFGLLRMPKTKLPKPDVVIISSLSLLTILNGFILRKIYDCRLVFEIRDIWPLTLTEEGGFSANNPFVKFLAMIEKIGYKYADEVVGTMPNLREHVTKVIGYERSVACIPMGFDMNISAEVLPLPESYTQEFIPSNKFIVAHVGSIGISNALDIFIECAMQLAERTDIHFLLVGDGQLREEYKRRCRFMSNISFGSKVNKSRVQSLLLKCNLLYFSSHVSEVWRYGQSLNKVIDYMLSGKPILASYSGYYSMINEANCGQFIPSGNVEALKNELLRLAALDPKALAEMGERGRNWVLKNRNYQKLALEYRAILFPE
jgi:glycosyltransferase involved in cell wall biosynthesis